MGVVLSRPASAAAIGSEGSRSMETGTAAAVRGLRGAQSARLIALALALCAVFGAAGFALVAAQDGATPVASPVTDESVGEAACPADLFGPGAEPWVRAELYFGTTRPDGSIVSEAEWSDFLDAEITPRFPDGLTVLTGLGQFRGDSGIIQERSQVLI